MEKLCKECAGTGVIEYEDFDGYYEALCPHCYESLGEVDEEN